MDPVGFSKAQDERLSPRHYEYQSLQVGPPASDSSAEDWLLDIHHQD